MGLFSAKITKGEAAAVEGLLKKAGESAKIINSTVKPDVFFSRLAFLLHFLLELKQYEKYKIFKGSTPTKDYKKVIKDLEKTVDSFIERSYRNAKEKAATYKTEKSRGKSLQDYAIAMVCAFEDPHQFNGVIDRRTRYTGALCTKKNIEKVKKIETEILFEN